MNHLNKISILFFLLLNLFFTACEKDNPTPGEDFGTFDLIFDNRVGDQAVSLVNADATEFPYTNNMGQSFNLTLLGYYISKIELAGPNGEYFADEISTGADAAQVKGFYHVLESDPNSQNIRLDRIPAGKYDQVTFTLGIDAETVQEGATGGVLDPAEGAWLWNWDAGYIAFGIEGRSPASPREADQFNPENGVQIHIGGWKDIAGNANMVNNVKRITLDFPSAVNIESRLSPNAHLEMDLLKVLDGHANNVDFSTTYAVHAPAKGKVFADNLAAAFSVDHVHQ
ncbi:MbnP family protein [Flavilitoribacter nigricans]|uniref:Copper-binding protein MbnP-like domain-containing protein n=1 Tax=Flavilitoribacter nigricans (strain ATCC 23147 / DSM 23189 / NBRC 102662 / NCIMB 1420 / SS-2) TaxID=1122177 RepID=A0A2D0N2M9_FLAN2|nr:MbnP family protein [Flavilitoribacter nigricans]PHN02707.1 hypothetical protein CRP01_30455 [Flavilitoribacter nigricans DSM 23189 = NBRC 102662]